MANGSNLLDEVEQGLGKVLPYALPAALGASLGGIPGALLGAASAMPTQEDYLKQQELQWQQTSRQAQMAFASDPGFQQEVAHTFGIDPSHVGALGLMEPKEFTTILEQFGKMRTAKKDVIGIRLPDGTWAQKDNRTGEVTPLPGEPTNAAIAEANQQAAAARAAQAEAAALQRTELSTGATIEAARIHAASHDPTELEQIMAAHPGMKIDDAIALKARLTRSPGTPKIQKVGDSLYALKYDPAADKWTNTKLMDAPKKYGSEFSTFAEGYVADHPDAKGPEITKAFEDSKTAAAVGKATALAGAPVKARLATIYNVDDPTQTKSVRVTEGYVPPKGWSLSKPAAPKVWTATDALNAVTKANNQAKLEGTKPGAIWGTRPPTSAELIARRRQILLGEHLNPDTGMQLKSGDVVTLPSGKRVKWVD